MPSLDRTVLAALVLGGAATLLPRLDYGLVLNDEGWLLHPVLRMLDGEVLYRDIWVHYAPLRYHLLEALFRITGPSLWVERVLLATMLLASAAGSYCLARRAAPPLLAALPGAVYLLAPGPWHKAPYALCTVACLLALARALERPTPQRLAAWGAVIGGALLLRHDLGMLHAGLATLALACWPASCAARVPRARACLLVVAPAAACVVFVGLFYAAQEALPALLDALLLRAFAQVGGSPIEPLGELLRGHSVEGAGAAVLLLAVPWIYAISGALGCAVLRRRGLEASVLVGAAVWLAGLAALPQAYLPPLVVRLLQSALPLYLISVALLAAAARRFGSVRALAPAAGALVAAALVYGVIAGFPTILPWPEYSGTWRAGVATRPVEVLGSEVRVREAAALEIELVRAFVGEHSAPGEPFFAWPWQSLYYVLLDRPNPTRILFGRKREGDWALAAASKQAELERLLASPTRYVLVWLPWWFELGQRDPIGRGIAAHFVPIRRYGSVLLLERSDDPERLALSEMWWELQREGWSLERAEDWGRYVAANPEEPLPMSIFAGLPIGLGNVRAAALMLESAHRLDPTNPLPIERLVALWISAGDLDAAAEQLARGRATRDSETFRRLAEEIAKRRAQGEAG